MNVFIERENKHKQLSFAGSAQKLCEKLEINPETVLVLKNNTLVTEDEILSDSDEITLITVVSGG